MEFHSFCFSLSSLRFFTTEAQSPQKDMEKNAFESLCALCVFVVFQKRLGIEASPYGLPERFWFS